MTTAPPNDPDQAFPAHTAPRQRVLRVSVDHDRGTAPEHAVRAEYLDANELAGILGLDPTQAAKILDRLGRGIAHHDRLGDEDLYVIPATAIEHPQQRREPPNGATPGEELRQLYDQGCRGLADVDMGDLLWRIFADVQDSYSLALREAGVHCTTAAVVTASVEDYLANHYGSE